MKALSTVFFVTVITLLGCNDNTLINHTQDSINGKGNILKSNDDSALITSLLDDAWRLQSVNPDSCIITANQALSLAQKHGFNSFSAEALCRIGNCEETKGNLDTAFEQYQQAFQYDSIAQNLHGMARDYYQAGIVLKKEGNYSAALSFSENALEIWGEMPDKKINMANASISIGNIYQRQGQFDLALKYFFRTLDTAIVIKNNGLIADAYNSIGLVYENQGLYDQALEKYRQSLALDEKRGNKKGIAGSYNNIGNIYYRKANLDSALNWYLKSVSLKETLGLTQGIAGTYNNIGLIYEGRSKYSEALDYHQKSLSLRRSSGDAQGIATSQNNIGGVLLKQGRPQDAIVAFKEALEIVQKTGGNFIQLEILKNLSSAYAADHNFQTAFIYMQQYQTSRDSIEDHFIKATETDTKYKEEKAKRELLEKEREKQNIELEKNKAVNQNQKIVLVSLSIFVILMLLLFFAYWKNKQRELIAEREEQENKKKIETLIQSQEVNALRMMLETQEKERRRIALDLHDGLGIKLSTAKLYYGLIGKKLRSSMTPEDEEKYETGNRMLDETCDELREVAHNLVSGELMKFGLINAIQNLCSTIEAASTIKIEFQAHGMDDRLDSTSEHCLYQIIQELLANIMRHAKAKEVTVQINRYNHTLNILVEDDGIGFDQNNNDKPEGLGLKSVRDRVHQLNGTIQIDSTLGSGTTTSIDIPM